MLRNQGLDIDLVHADISIQNYQNVLRPSTPVYTDIHHEFTSRYWSIPRRGDIGMNSWHKKFVKEVLTYIDHLGAPDIIHAHTFLGGWVAMEIKNLLNIPYVITEHSTQVLEKRLSKTHNKIATESYRHADAVVAVGRTLADVIHSEHGVDARVIPNFINVNLFNIPTDKSGPIEELQLIAIGDLIKRKNFDKVIKACESLTIKYHLRIVGTGSEKATLMEQASAAKVTVSFLGQRSQEEISELLKKSHLLVHPSKTETFGIILIEAMATGIPVISYNNGGAEDIITRQSGILLKDNSVAALTAAIETVQYNYASYKAADIRQIVIDGFSPAAIAPQLIDLYTSHIG